MAVWGMVAAGWILFGEQAGGGGADGPTDRASVAVLPFDNLSTDDEADPFTDGIHDDLLTQLAKIDALKVISRTSVMEYRGATKSIPEIGAELGVSAVVEGGVQRAGDRIRLNAQLIDTASDEHLWAETFDRRLTADNVFEIQSELARRIASALGAELTPGEERRLARRPTENLEAYRLHLRARDLVRRSLAPPDVRAAMALWERAIELDPEFALAHAYLSIHHTLSYARHRDDSPERLERARRAAERALELDPELAEAHVAMARYHYRAQLDYERALRELEIARRLQSGNAEVLQTIAAVRRRQGKFERALELWQEVVELDPRNAVEFWQLAITQRFLRDYEGAIRTLDRAIELSPTYPNPYARKAGNLVLARGDTEAALGVLDEWESILGPSDAIRRHRARYLLLERDYSGALEARTALPEDGVVDDHLRFRPHHLLLAEGHRYLGDDMAARRHYEAARAHLQERLRRTPNDPRIHGALGLALAGLGRSGEAVAHAERAVELMPVEREAFRGPQRLEELAYVHAHTGNTEKALDTLERLLEIPSFVSVPQVRLDPRWDPLRGEARFREMMEGRQIERGVG